MRIAIVSTLESVPWTGCEELWAATADAALDAGHQVFCSVCRWPATPPPIAQLEAKGAKVFRRRKRRLPSMDGIVTRIAGRPMRVPRPNALAFTSSYKGIFDIRPDVILLSQAGTYDYHHIKDVVCWIQRSEKPYVVVNQLNFDAYVPESRHFREARAFFSAAARVAFVSSHNLRVVERQLALRLPKAFVIQNPVNLREAGILPWPPQPPLSFASAARLDANHKGHDLLLEAFSAESWRARDWKFTFYGSGADEEYMRRLVEFYELREHVSFGGQVSDVREIWRKHHLGVLASRWEGTPLALIESMLCGRASIVTDVGGNAEWITDGVSGFVAAGATTASVAEALDRAWSARGELMTFGEKAFAAANEKRDPEPAKTLLHVIEQAAAAVRTSGDRG